ncbi:hypothetical protein GQ600_27887 [Phytophthora cactorum]|nr:hypothetical protein GQ600_27887 [Phytophthora cactorum]
MGSMLLRHSRAVSTHASILHTGGNGADSHVKWLGYFATFCWAQGTNRHNKDNQHSTIILKLASINWFHRRYRDLLIRRPPVSLYCYKVSSGYPPQAEEATNHHAISPSPVPQSQLRETAAATTVGYHTDWILLHAEKVRVFDGRTSAAL